MELSQAFQKQAKKMNATPQYVILADLMSIGYSEIDAYTIAYPENEALSAQQNKGIRENILKSVVNCFQMCIFARGKTTSSTVIENDWLWQRR